MVKKPAVCLKTAAGFLIFSVHLPLTMACKIQADDAGLPNGLQATPGATNVQLVSACMNYCFQMYDSATECPDEERLEEGQTACEISCEILDKRLPDQCEELFIDYYDCVVVEDVQYACDTDTLDPLPLDGVCEEFVTEANECIGLSSST